MAKKKLPSKPSDLIFLAIKDLEKIEKTKGYRVDMSAWHEPITDADKRLCEVCLAGSVMAVSLKIGRHQNMSIYDFKGDTRGKLEAIDCFRQGEIHQGLLKIGIDPFDHFVPQSYTVVEYGVDKRRFKQQMLKIAGFFKAVGL